jgi:hypothetical protein
MAPTRRDARSHGEDLVTITTAREIAEFVFSEGNAIGVVQRSAKMGFVVGCCYVDGRKAEVKGRSRVDWKSAFMVAVDGDTSLRARVDDAFARWRIS